MQRPNRPAWSQCVANSMPQCSCDHGANIGTTKIPRNNYLFETMTLQHATRVRWIRFRTDASAERVSAHGNPTTRDTSTRGAWIAPYLPHNESPREGNSSAGNRAA